VTYPQNHSRSLRQIFAIPGALGLLSAMGLITALAGDGLLDVLSWLALGAPVSMCCFRSGLKRSGLKK
jgi:hypothetical protein